MEATYSTSSRLRQRLAVANGCGTIPSRRQSATTAGAPTEQARVCLAAPPPASTTLLVSSIRASRGGRHVKSVPEPSAWAFLALQVDHGFLGYPSASAESWDARATNPYSNH